MCKGGMQVAHQKYKENLEFVFHLNVPSLELNISIQMSRYGLKLVQHVICWAFLLFYSTVSYQ